MTKRTRNECDDLNEIVVMTDVKMDEFYKKVLDNLCTNRGLNDLLFIYPTNSFYDPHTMDTLAYFFTSYKSEGEIKIMKYIDIDPVLSGALLKFCRDLHKVKNTRIGEGDSCNIFSYIDFNYKIREGSNLNPNYARIYSEVNHIKGTTKPFAEFVKQQVKEFFEDCDLSDPVNLRRVILHLDARCKHYSLTANFIAWALLEIFFEENKKNLKSLIEATAQENYTENIKRGQSIPGEYFKRNYRGWRAFIIL